MFFGCGFPTRNFFFDKSDKKLLQEEGERESEKPYLKTLDCIFCNQIQTNMLHEADTEDMGHHLFSIIPERKEKKKDKENNQI